MKNITNFSPIHKQLMTDPYNMNEYDKFYIEYGKFIIHFENINFQLCYYIRKICTSDQMFSEEDRRIDIFLEGLTANPLLSKFKSIFLTTELSKNLEIKNLVDRFAKNFVKVIEIRNFVAHGTFFLGDPHGNVENFEVRKPKLSSKGYQQNVNIISIQSLQKLNDDIQKLENFISNLKLYVKNIGKEHMVEIYNEMKSGLENLDISLKILNKSID